MSDLTARAIADLRQQLIEALAVIEFWRTECEQQRTRAEAAEQEAAELAGVIRDVSAMLAQAQEMLN